MNAMDPAATAEAELFDDVLSCDLVLPAQFLPGAEVKRPGASEMLLRSVAMVEDARTTDDGEERTDNSAQLQRLEARMDLVLVLLGRLLQDSIQAPASTALRWSRRGLRIDQAAPRAPEAGTTGVLRLQPAEWLPDQIELPVTVLATAESVQGCQLWLRLDPVSEPLASALDKHLFRLHRKQIADSRRNR